MGIWTSKLLGMIMVSKIQNGGDEPWIHPEKERKDFSPLWDGVSKISSWVLRFYFVRKLRKYRLNLLLRISIFRQITSSSEKRKTRRPLRDAVFRNMGSMMCLKLVHDAEPWKKFQPCFRQQDLINIANYQAYIKTHISITPRSWVSPNHLRPTGADEETAEAYRQLSLNLDEIEEFEQRNCTKSYLMVLKGEFLHSKSSYFKKRRKNKNVLTKK